MAKTNNGGRLTPRSKRWRGITEGDRRSICRELAERWIIPRDLWVRQSEREKAEGELLTLQGPNDERSLTRSDLSAAIDAYHKHLIDVSRRDSVLRGLPDVGAGLVRHTQVVAFGGSVSLEDQSPEKLATCIGIRGGSVMVSRGTAPSFPEAGLGPDYRGPVICLDIRLSFSQFEAGHGVQS